jgi:ADP-ribose pyrophosphatase
MSFEIVNRQSIFQGRVFTVERVQVTLPNQKQASYEIVSHHGAVTIIPVDEQGMILFVRQYRLPAGEDLLELPAGTLEDNEDPLYAAGREIREETDMAAAELRELGQYYLAPGYSTEFMHTYLATGLSNSPLDADEDEFLDLVKIPIREAYRMAHAGEIRDSKTLASLFLAEPYLLKNDA